MAAKPPKTKASLKEYPNKAIGILGGVGPEAGVCLEQYVLKEMREQNPIEKDQDHIPTFHFSCPNLISDRTEFLTEAEEDNPAKGAFKVLELFEAMAELQHEELYVGIPCNTFHAPKIFSQLEKMIAAKDLEHVHVLNMIEETGQAIAKVYPDIKKIGLLSTTGTRQAKIYHSILQPRGYQIVQVPEDKQAQVHEAIYHPDWGIKASADKTQARNRFLSFVDELIEQGAQAIILGCTEIPLVLPEEAIRDIPLIDPMRILAQTLVRESSPKP